jgi:DNA-binding transcriptional ArsR family regulator
MKAGPDIAIVSALVGDPARANMLTALMAGQALTATELAHEAGVTVQTASSHLSKMHDGGLIRVERQGRHRYYRLSGPDVAAVLEGLAGLAARVGHMRVRLGPRDAGLRNARVCYDHLAGERGVQMLDSMLAGGLVRQRASGLDLTPAGRQFAGDFGIDLAQFASSRRPLCKSCLDWSVRRPHLAGAFGAALLRRFYDLGWAHREEGTRILRFTRRGDQQFAGLFGAKIAA